MSQICQVTDQSSIWSGKSCQVGKCVGLLNSPTFVDMAYVSGHWPIQHLLIWLMCQVTDQSNICWCGICVRSLTNPTFVDVAYVSGHGPTFDLASCSGFGPAQHLLTWQMCQVTYQSNIWSGKFVRSNIWPGKFARSLNSSTSVNMVNWSDHWP